MFEPINNRDGKAGDQTCDRDAAHEGSDFALEASSFELNIKEGCADFAKGGCATRFDDGEQSAPTRDHRS